MTAEDRHSVDGLCQLLRDEVQVAMGHVASDSERPVWLGTGEQQLVRSMRAGVPSMAASRSALLSGGSRVRAWLLAALVAGGVGIGAGLVTLENASRADGPALTFEMNQGGDAGSRDAGSRDAGRRSGRVIAPDDRAEDVRFSDGSRFTLAAGSMLRVRETDARGAMVIVEEGQVESSVRHTDQARWSVFAGPYEVRVVGTRFSTAWDPERQRLSVVLHEGSVQVLGKGIQELVELKPGQRFESDGSEGKWFVTATSSPRAAEQATEITSAAPARAAGDGALSGSMPSDGAPRGAMSGALRSSRAAAAGDPPVDTPSWSTLVASGKFEEVLDRASVEGEAACLTGCSIADLRALADAARYTGRFTLAERALSRLRTLAPSEAPRAGFLLGSMNEAQGRPSAALEWYGHYLEEAPGGGLAAEARAGRMRALLALGQTEAAKAAARDYLRLHPAGVGANTARQILNRP